MARFQEIITDDYLRPIPNVAVDVLTAAGTLADLVDDEDDPLPNPLKTDEFGQLIFNAPDAVYTLQYRFGGALRRIDNRIVGDPPEFRGSAGLAANTFSDLSLFKAASTTQFKVANLSLSPPVPGTPDGQFYFETAGAPYTADDNNVIKADDTSLSTGAWVRQGADKVATKAPGTGAIIEPVGQLLNRRLIDVVRYNADPTGDADATVPFANAAVAVRNSGLSDGSRIFAGLVFVPHGRYTVSGLLAMAPPTGVTGLTFVGDGAGSTELVFDLPESTITVAGSRSVTFMDMSFRSIDPYVDVLVPGQTPGSPGNIIPGTYGIDLEQSAFSINRAPGDSALRSWRFVRCDFSGFWKCFYVTGETMCSEFFFQDCNFSNCYYLMDNENDQAVNWNFSNCCFEGDHLDTLKDVTLSSAFRLVKGTFVQWVGGSLIFQGALIRTHFVGTSNFAIGSHGFNFIGTRLELAPTVDGGSIRGPMIDRSSEDQPNGGNGIQVAFINCPTINRGTIDRTTTKLIRMWNGCDISIVGGGWEGGLIEGIVNYQTEDQNAILTGRNISNDIEYIEDRSAQSDFDHIGHTVDLEYASVGGLPGRIVRMRNSRNSVGQVRTPTVVSWHGRTGSVPVDGEFCPIPRLQPRTFLKTLDATLATPMAADLTLDIVKADPANPLVPHPTDTAVLYTLTVTAGDIFDETRIHAEVGFQIPNVPLGIKATGGTGATKGYVNLTYL